LCRKERAKNFESTNAEGVVVEIQVQEFGSFLKDGDEEIKCLEAFFSGESCNYVVDLEMFNGGDDALFEKLLHGGENVGVPNATGQVEFGDNSAIGVVE
jgi:hypothetical protein